MNSSYFVSLEKIEDETYFWIKLDKLINTSSFYWCNIQMFKLKRYPKYKVYKIFEL